MQGLVLSSLCGNSLCCWADHHVVESPENAEKRKKCHKSTEPCVCANKKCFRLGPAVPPAKQRQQRPKAPSDGPVSGRDFLDTEAQEVPTGPSTSGFGKVLSKLETKAHEAISNLATHAAKKDKNNKRARRE